MIADFHFLRPLWLLALIVPPLLMWLSLRSADLRSRWKGLIAPHLLDALVVAPEGRSRDRPSWMLAIVLVIAIFAAAGPTWMREAPPFVKDTASLVIAVDLSPTMDAVDISPSRIERAKLKIRDILSTRGGAKTAVVAYSGTAHLVVPLTDDLDLIENYTDALATRVMPRPGKDTVAALKLSESILRGDAATGTILFLTDAVETEALQSLKAATDSIIILGIGTAQGGPVRQLGGGFATDSAGTRVLSQMDLAALENIGSATGAAVATVTDDDADVRWIAQRVTTNFAQASAADGERWHDFGWWLLLPAAVLFAFSFRRGWVVRVATVVLAVNLVFPENAQSAGLMDIWLTPDQQGRIAFDRSDYIGAARLFRDPMWRGIAQYRAGQFQAASVAFAELNTPEAWYNRGNAFLHLERYEDAVGAYRMTLQQRAGWTDAQSNMAIAQRLLLQQKQDEDDQPQEPNQRPDQIQFDDKGDKFKAGRIDVAEQTSEMWMKNIEVSPADLMARKFVMELEGTTR